MNNKVIFEGAGWDGADHNGVGNCRIRTRIRNIDGRVIYLEMGGTRFTGKNIPHFAKDYDFCGRVDHCFYSDSKEDSKRNYSSELSHLERKNFKYSKEAILRFVNENLNCNFSELEVINNELCVHDTEEPLCDCSRESCMSF